MEPTTSAANDEGVISDTEETAESAQASTPGTLSMLERIEKATSTLSEVEKRIDVKSKEIEELLTRQVMGGKALAGNNVTPEQERTSMIQEEVNRAVKRLMG